MMLAGRRLVLLLLLAGAACAAWLMLRRDAPPMAPASPAPPPPRPPARWLPPVAGENPEGYPIKANKSGIYHVPGGRFYARTVAERCYADTADAEADGYRRSKA